MGNYSIEEIAIILEHPLRYITANWDLKNANEIANDLGIKKRQLYRITAGKLRQKQYVVRHARLQSGRLVFDNETGIYYDNIPVCAEAYGFNKSTFRDYMIGRLGKRKKILTRFKLL